MTEEEREGKYVRMLTSSLLGVKRLLTLLLQSDRTALEERLAHLLNSGKFWKYSKHKTPQVLTLNRTVLNYFAWYMHIMYIMCNFFVVYILLTS